MKRGIVFGGLAAAAAVAAVLLVLFALGFFDPDAPAPAPREETAVETPRATHEPADPRGRGASRDVAIEPSSAAPSAAAMPEPYRKALSGVTGRVVEADGKPLAGFAVTLVEIRFGPILSSLGESFDAGGAPEPAFEIDETLTGEDGRFLLGGAFGWAVHAIGVNLGGPRSTLRVLDRTFPRGEVLDVGDIVLAPNIAFTGRVVDETGNPVAGARVRGTNAPPVVFQAGVEHLRPASRVIAMHEEKKMLFEIPPWILAFEKRLPIPTATTDADGRYRLEGLPRGLVSVVVDREGFVALAAPSIPTGDGAEREIDPLVLSRGRRLAGRVVDAAERPVAGVEVVGGAIVPIGRAAIAKPSAAVTDAAGRFAIENVPLFGAAAVAARSAPHAAWKIVGPTYDDENVVVVLDDALSLSVLLRTAAGEVVPEADVRLRPWVEDVGGFPLAIAPYLDAGGRVRRAESGRIVIEGLSPGRYEMIGRAKGFGFAKADVTVGAATSEVTLEFPEGRSVVVRVLDDATGAPVEWVTVSAVTVPMEMHAIDRRRTGADGRAALAALPAANADGKPKVRIVAEHPAYARHAIEVDPAVASEAELPMRLVPGGALAGRVHDGGAVPAKPVMITLMRAGAPDEGPEFEVPRMTVADHEGKFKFDALEPGEYRYDAGDRFFEGDALEIVMKSMTLDSGQRTHRSGEVTIVAGETAEVDIDISMAALGPTAYLRGIVRVNGEPLANGTVSFWREGLGSSLRANTDERGEFQFGEVPAGQSHLNVMRRTPGEGGGPGGRDSVHSMQIELSPGEDRYLEIDASVIEVPVLVTLEDGSPVEGANVNFIGRSEETGRKNGYGSTDKDGRARVVVGGPGPYTVTAQKEGAGRVSRAVEIAASPEPIVLALEAGVVFSGTIVFEDGGTRDSGERTWVFLKRVENGREIDQQVVQIEDEGNAFEFKNASPGHYRMMVYMGDGWSQEFLLEIPEGGTTGFTFVARRQTER